MLPTAIERFEYDGTSGCLRFILDCASQVAVISDTFVDQYRIELYKSESIIDEGLWKHKLRIELCSENNIPTFFVWDRCYGGYCAFCRLRLQNILYQVDVHRLPN